MERGVAVGLEKKGGGRKKGLGFCTYTGSSPPVRIINRMIVAGTGGDGWRHHHRRFILPEPVVMRTITAGSYYLNQR
jgi:hypothetical protein